MKAGAAKTIVLDTSILEQDPGVLFRFPDETLLIPAVVVESLDPEGRTLAPGSARNLRTAAGYLEDLMEGAAGAGPEREVAVPGRPDAAGRIVFQHEEALAGNAGAKERVLAAVRSAQERHPGTRVVLLSADAGLRVRARLAGIAVQDGRADRSPDAAALLYRGVAELPRDAALSDAVRPGDAGRLRTPGDHPPPWLPNQCLFRGPPSPADLIVREVEPGGARVRAARDFREGATPVWGIHARNREQNFALDFLTDESGGLVTLTGASGSGKTLLALAAGLSQTFESKRYREIVVTRATVPVGDDIGFLPGTEEEKMGPWMGALDDNLEVLGESRVGGTFGRAASRDLLNARLRIRSLNFMRGRTFLHRYVILDEAQNLTPAQMKTLLTRIGPGSKAVCLGNVAQIDTPCLTATTSGLGYVVERMKTWKYSAHVTLRHGERSRLAARAAALL